MLRKIISTPFQLPIRMSIGIQRALFSCFFVLFLIVQWTGHIFVLNRDLVLTDTVLKIFKIIIFALMFIKIIFQKYDLLRVFIIIFLSTLLVTSALLSHDKTVLWTFLVLLAAQNVNWKTVGWSAIAATALIVAFDVAVNQQGRSVEFIDSRDMHGIRFSLGFSHPNLAALFMFLIAMSLFLLLRNYKVMSFCVIVAALAVVVVLLSSRTEIIGLLSLMLFLPLGYLQERNLCKKTLYAISCVICLFCDFLCILSFYASYFYTPHSTIFRLLDKLFSGRLSLLHGYLHGGGITPFGRTFSDFSTGNYDSFGNEVNFIADNFYVRPVLLYGFVTGGLLIIIFIATQWYLAITRDIDFYPFTVPLIMGIAESLALFADKNIMVFAMAHILFKGLEEEPRYAKHKSNRVEDRHFEECY